MKIELEMGQNLRILLPDSPFHFKETLKKPPAGIDGGK